MASSSFNMKTDFTLSEVNTQYITIPTGAVEASIYVKNPLSGNWQYAGFYALASIPEGTTWDTGATCFTIRSGNSITVTVNRDGTQYAATAMRLYWR